mmetsp:Transcript_58919/g.108850  ORF Transcript_58919/g.108850 Transcript_58919/m.108850 type:complete len:481 (+) Transcript_58919:71-1513(+)
MARGCHGLTVLTTFLLWGVQLLTGGVALARASRDPFPVPPRQSPTQKAVCQHHAPLAEAASAAATAKVLEFFDRADFRAGLEKCCSGIAKLPASEILERFREEVRAAELAHDFPAEAEDSKVFYDQTMSLMEEYPFFLNQWQAMVADEAEGVPRKAIAGALTVPEENLFGCPRFQNRSQPTWDEAAGRAIYTAHNLWLVDSSSSPHFGNVTAVFRYKSVQDLVVFAPIDTGLYYAACHDDMPPGPPILPFNCKGWVPETLGTFAHFDHMILANWEVLSGKHNVTVVEEALRFFNHSPFALGNYSELATLNDVWIGDYWESLIFGAPQLATDIRFVLPVFSMFGTSKGEHLQKLAERHSWPVLWVFGEVSNKDLPGKVRLLDPHSVAYAKLNVTVTEAMRQAYDDLWARVAAARKQKGSLTEQESLEFWSELKEDQVWVAPATARVCGYDDSCIGAAIRSDNACICSAAAHSAEKPATIMV